jgi:hypothetical protein
MRSSHASLSKASPRSSAAWRATALGGRRELHEDPHDPFVRAGALRSILLRGRGKREEQSSHEAGRIWQRMGTPVRNPRQQRDEEIETFLIDTPVRALSIVNRRSAGAFSAPERQPPPPPAPGAAISAGSSSQ